MAWLYDSGDLEFLGIQYQGAHNSDSIELAAGFGFGDMGTFCR
ncbi:hypothetical protein [Thiohalocapsa sp. ML1]|nr:hypothetical protein [Thiohalocapsa sp. ML1]